MKLEIYEIATGILVSRLIDLMTCDSFSNALVDTFVKSWHLGFILVS